MLTWGSVSPQELNAIADMLDSLGGAGLEVADTAIAVLSDQMGYELQRKKQAPSLPVPPGPVAPFNAPTPFHERIDEVARAGRANLAREFRGAFAPVRRILEESKSPDEFLAKLSAYYADFTPGRIASIAEQALAAYSANGAAEVATKL